VATDPYDEFDYPSHAYWTTHPDNLATLAQLYGQTPAPVEDCRVLEIGCGAGGNLIPMALAMPDAQIVGVDPAQYVEKGQQIVADLGLKNVELKRCGAQDIDDSFGDFDYVLCHGVFSWVPQDVRTAILGVCRDRLRPSGVACISYNVYPGWFEGEMLREMMLYHTDPHSRPGDRVHRARELLSFLSSVADDVGTTRNRFFKWQNKEWQGSTDGYLFHEYFAPVNQPYYFHDFVALAERHRLRYLGDANRETNAFDNQTPQLAAALKQCRDVVEGQQYLDFATNRRFRTSLLVHDDKAVDLAVRPERLSGLSVRTDLAEDPGVGDLEEELSLEGRTVGAAAVRGAPLRTALSLLHAISPAAMPIEKLLERTFGQVEARAEGAHDDLRRDLAALYFSRIVHLHSRQARVSGQLSEHPMTARYARRQTLTSHRVTNQWHQHHHLGEDTRALLQRLDGTMTREQAQADAPEALEELRWKAFLLD